MLLDRGLRHPKNIVETSVLPVTMPLLQITDMIALLPEQAVGPYCDVGLLTILPIGPRRDDEILRHHYAPRASSVAWRRGSATQCCRNLA
jgi:hypothetical protein